MTVGDAITMIVILALWDNVIKPLSDLVSLQIIIWIKTRERNREAR
jgi:hypothetical protein